MEPITAGSDALHDASLGPVSAVIRNTTELDAIHSIRRRAMIDQRQERVGRLLEELNCEGAILLVPAHVNWFTGGINLRGLLADSERPGIYTNGRQRWLLSSVADTQRLFDEELDGLGFQVKEWQWASGRAVLLAELVAGRKIAVDRPFPNLPQIGEKLRHDVRTFNAHEQDDYQKLGLLVAHAVEATGRTIAPGATEEEIAGQVAHRLCHRGVDPVSVSVIADSRGGKYRRAGFTPAATHQACIIQATGTRRGLYSTASRTVCFGKCPDAYRAEYDAACKVSAAARSLSLSGETVGAVAEAGWRLLANSRFEYEGRLSQPGYGTGRVPAEELRRAGHDEPFAPGWALVWQSRIGSAAVVDTVLVTDSAPRIMTPPEAWPFKKITIRGVVHEVPDILERDV